MKQRDSNIELLRIVATLFILIVHCNGWLLTFGEPPIEWDFGGPMVSISRVLIQNITAIGVNLFILISGFYGIHPKISSIVNLFTCLLFFYCGSFLLNCGLGYEEFTIKHFIKSLMAFSHENWFINCYLFLILLSPIINVFVENMSKRNMLIYICVFMICAFYFGCIINSKYFYFNEGYSVTMMIIVYIVGHYIKRYLSDRIDMIKYKKIVFVYIISLLFMIGSFIVQQYIEVPIHTYCSPFYIFSAVCMFLLFYRIPKFYNPIVNWFGKSCLAAYILHTSSPFVHWLASLDYELITTDNYGIYMVKMLGVVLVLFVASILLDKVRILIFYPLQKWIIQKEKNILLLH